MSAAGPSLDRYSRLFRLDGRTAVVVGAGSGLGRASALALGAFGAAVMCADIDLASASETARLAGPGAEPLLLDARDPDRVEAVAREGRPEVLVFSAGVNVRQRLLEYRDQDFERVVDLNLRGCFNLLRAFGAIMAERGGGSIIGFSSIRAVTVEPGQGVYAATKAGMIQLLRAAAAELGPRGVRANAIAPGVVETPLTAPIQAVAAWRDAYSAKTALGRWGRPEEIAGAVVYLAGDASSYVTGSVLVVDGGWTAVDGRFEPPAP